MATDATEPHKSRAPFIAITSTRWGIGGLTGVAILTLIGCTISQAPATSVPIIEPNPKVTTPPGETVPAAEVAIVQADHASIERPNIIFFLIDDLGWMDLGYSGSTFYETPNVDALAASGMVLTNAYAACPVCSPTRASIMSGKYPARMNTTDWFGAPQPDAIASGESNHRTNRKPLLPAAYVPHLPLEEVTIAEALQANGYATGFFGKWHLGEDPSLWPDAQGFDVNVGGWTSGSPHGGYFAPYRNPRLEQGPDGEHLPARLANEAAAFISANRDQPKFVMFSMYSVHTPLQSPDDDTEYFREKSDAAGLENHWTTQGDREVRMVQNHAVYAGMVKAMDDAVGRVVRAVEEAGELDRTLFVFFSDNGGLSTSEGSPTSNAPLRAGKGWLYEGGIREPCIIAWPGRITAGSTSDQLVISNDFYPTLLEAAALPLDHDQHVDGVSLMPILRGQTERLERSTIFWHYPHYGNQGGSPGSAVRDGDWKLIRFFESGRNPELYNLAEDIGESDNRFEAEPIVAVRLNALLDEWLNNVDAQYPTPNPRAAE